MMGFAPTPDVQRKPMTEEVEVDGRRNPALARLASPAKLSVSAPVNKVVTPAPVAAPVEPTVAGTADEDVMAAMRAANRPLK